ncbi:MAG: glycosyltransferase [Deltaproteobacteria bacterium]|nr:glycosyltransferase [Deltaproteobacteria bacterium]
MKITVVTPSFNQGRFIEETIKSVISQEGDFFLEYIIMDAVSTDETVEVIKKYERLLEKNKFPVKCKGVKLIWKSEKDKGQTHAVNKGFTLATGEILGWVNSDDTYQPGAISKAFEYFKKNKDVMMVYGEGYYIDKAGKALGKFDSKPFDFALLAERCYIFQPAAFIRTAVFKKLGGLDESLHMCMDYEYWIRIGKEYRVEYLPGEHLANSRVYAETKTLSRTPEAYEEGIKVVRKYYGKVPDAWFYGLAHYSALRSFPRLSGIKPVLILLTMSGYVLKKAKTMLFGQR